MIARLLKSKLAKSPKSILLLGPRQVGKSTLIADLLPDIEINLNDDKTYLDFKSNPNELKERLVTKEKQTVFIDEIQRHPTLLNVIQTIIDQDKGRLFKFFISGSSARKLKRGQANLLPGRIFAYELGPLCAGELNYDLDIKRALRVGTLPEPYLNTQSGFSEKLLTTYAGTYLKEEIQAEALTRNLDGFSRFLMEAAKSSGYILDFSKVAKQAKIERKECSRFYEILEDTLIAKRVDVFTDTKADIIKRPKFYLFDPGVLNGLLENFIVSEDRKGILFEHLVLTQIVNSAKARDLPIKLSYFRTRSGYEVDFILKIGHDIHAIEVKSGTIHADDAKKLESFRKYFPKAKNLFLVGIDTSSRKIGSVQICDLNRLLKKLSL